jgi:glycopeptide antibiotics resistance protein
MTDAATERLIRRWGWIGLIGVAAFAAYISLVPFNFTRPAGLGDLFRTFASRIEFIISSHGNFLANIVLFVPVGFCGGAALIGLRRHTAGVALAGAALLIAAALLSFAIEITQVLVPGRTPSWADITAQCIGAAGGLALWLLIAGEVARWVGRWVAGQRQTVLQLVLGLYTLGRALVMLMPLDVTVDLALLARKFRDGGIVINPLRSTVFRADVFPSLLSDAALALPVGLFAALAGTKSGTRRGVVPAVMLGITFMTLIEVAQVFVRSRTADVMDLFANCVGVTIGAFVVARSSGKATAGTERWRAALWPGIFLVLAAAFYAVYNWVPFDFRFGSAMINERLPRLWQVPFHSYYINPEFKALDDILLKMALGVPVGLCLRNLLGRGATTYRRTTLVAAFALSGLFFAAVECGQVLLPSRYPDNTDVLLALAGAAAGWKVAGVLQQTLQRRESR